MGENIATFYLPSKMIKSITWSKHENKFMVTSLAGALFYYTIGERKRPVTFEVPQFFPTASIFTSDEFVISASNSGKLAKFDIHSELVKVASVHSSSINDMKYSKLLDLILTASNDKTIKIFDTNLKFLRSFTHHKTMVTRLATNKVNTLCVSGDLHGNVFIWDINEPEKIIAHKQIAIGSKNGIESLSFDSTGTLFTVATTDKHVSVWTIEMKLLQAFNCNSNMLKFSPKLPMILSSNNDEPPCVYSIEAAAKILSIEGLSGNSTAVEWSPSGKYFVTADANGQILVWKTGLENFNVQWMEKDLSETHMEQKKAMLNKNSIVNQKKSK